MPDGRKVHLLVERDPVGDYPDSFVRVMLLHGQLWGEGYRDGPSWWQTDGDVEAGTPDAWTPLPTDSDLTVEGVRAVLEAADRFAIEHEQRHQTEMDYLSAGLYREAIHAITLKLRAALGTEAKDA